MESCSWSNCVDCGGHKGVSEGRDSSNAYSSARATRRASRRSIRRGPIFPFHSHHRSSLNLKQDFLEYTPYHDHSNVKVNSFKGKTPFTGQVFFQRRIVGPKATGET